MMTAIRVERRRFLQLSAGLVALLAIQPAARLTGWQHGQDLFASPWQRLFSQPESAGVIGQVYLHAHPHEANAAWLIQQITQDVAGGNAAFGGAGSDELKALLQQRIRQDFADEHVVKLNGWILARTEGRLYALAALLRQARAGVAA